MTKIERILTNLPPVIAIRNRTKKIFLPGFNGISFYDVFLLFWKEIGKYQLGDRASAISWNFLIAIPPTFIFLFTLLPYLHIKSIETTLSKMIYDISPNRNSYKIVTGVIHDFLHTPRQALLSFSFLLGVFYSSSGVQGILRTFDKISPVFIQRNSFQRRWAAIKITALLLALILSCVLLIIGQGAIIKFIFSLFHIKNNALIFFLNVFRWVMIIIMFFFNISLIYRFGPSVKKKWKFLSPGSALATLLIILTTLGFSIYVRNFSSYNKIYGSIGSVIVLMLWVYLNSLVLLIGFELNASIAFLSDHADTHQKTIRTGTQEKNRVGRSTRKRKQK
jgi:membrane protein